MHAFVIEKTASPAKNVVSAHDIQTIMGFDQYRSPLELWAERTGKTPRSEPTFKMWLSGRQREVILDSYERLHKTKLKKSRDAFRHPNIDFAIAHPHGWLEEEADELLVDCKNISERQWRTFGPEREIPTKYLIGCNWTMGVMGMPQGTIAALVGGSDIEECPLSFDEAIFDKCCDRALEFIECIEKDIPPNAGANDLRLINLLIGERSGGIDQTEDSELCEMASKALKLQEQRLELNHQAQDLEEEEKTIKNQIAQRCGASSGLLIHSAFSGESVIVKISEVSVKERVQKAFSYPKITIKKG